MRFATIFLSCVLMTATPALAAGNDPVASSGTVDCWDASNSSRTPLVWRYVIKSTPSRRLGSDIFCDSETICGPGQILISSANVAQYDALQSRLFILVDTAFEQLDIRFQTGKPSTTATFSGKLQKFGPDTSAVIATLKLKCIITP